MLIRWLVILAILTQPLTLLSVSPALAQQHNCVAMSCCGMIESTNCCGERITKQVCSRSGGPCQCAAAPSNDHDSRPQAPQPRTDRESLLAIPAPPVASIQLDRSATGARDGMTAGVTLHARHTHNEVQAILGVWRT